MRSISFGLKMNTMPEGWLSKSDNHLFQKQFQFDSATPQNLFCAELLKNKHTHQIRITATELDEPKMVDVQIRDMSSSKHLEALRVIQTIEESYKKVNEQDDKTTHFWPWT